VQLYPRYDGLGSDAQVSLTVESKGTRMRAYHRLTEGERNQVYALKKAGLTQCAIAEQINGHLKDNDQPSVSPEWI
jgi:hypothetical protein